MTMGQRRVGIHPNSTSGTSTEVALQAESDVSPLPFATPRYLPMSLGSGQAYFWTQKWHSDEMESRKAFEQGKGRIFDTGQDAIRWLLPEGE